MIRKGNKALHVFKGDREPISIYKGGKPIVEAEEAESSSVFSTPYKPIIGVEATGANEQSSRVQPVYEASGEAFKYSQLFSCPFESSAKYGVTLTKKSDGIMNIEGTATANAVFTMSPQIIRTGDKIAVLGSPKSGAFIQFIFSDGTSNIGTDRIITAKSDVTDIRIRVANGTTVNEDFRPYIANLTHDFGAGNEPTTIEEFYATPQGARYRSFVPYGYHIGGAGEYKSNQLAVFADSKIPSARSGLVFSRNDEKSFRIKGTATQTDNASGWFNLSESGAFKNKAEHKLLIVTTGNRKLRWSTTYGSTYGFGETNIVTLKKDDSRNFIRFIIAWSNGEVFDDIFSFVVTDLTDLGLDHLTLDELRAQRPDLFVYQPFHETETRHGLIMSDGSVYPLSAPIYGIGDAKDTARTDGIITRRTKIEDGEVVALANPIVELQEPVEYPSGLSVLNADFTETSVQTPTPQFPEPISATRVVFNGEDLGLELNQGDYAVASRKVGKNLFDISKVVKSAFSVEGTKITRTSTVGYYLDLFTGFAGSTTAVADVSKIMNLKKGVYTFSVAESNTSIAIRKVERDGTITSLGTFNQSANRTLSLEDDENYITLRMSDISTSSTKYYADGIMVELGSTATSYEPYIKGKTWVKRAMGERSNLDSLEWQKGSSASVFITERQVVIPLHTPNIICNRYKAQYASSGIQSAIQDKHIATNANRQLIVKDTNYTDPTAFKNSLAGARLLYELSNPIWQDITDTDVGRRMLNLSAKWGDNEISATIGEAKVRYYKEK